MRVKGEWLSGESEARKYESVKTQNGIDSDLNGYWELRQGTGPEE